MHLSVGAMRGSSDAGGRNIVSFMPSGSKIRVLRELVERLAAHAADDVAEQEEVDVAVDEARARRSGRAPPRSRARSPCRSRSTVVAEVEVRPQPRHVRHQVADRDVRLAVALEARNERRDAVAQADLALPRRASSRSSSSRRPWSATPDRRPCRASSARRPEPARGCRSPSGTARGRRGRRGRRRRAASSPRWPASPAARSHRACADRDLRMPSRPPASAGSLRPAAQP